ncbi:AtpZ/AtpI family protein [Salimicrobium sp. PL1-032A]|uniref:AtpZ/AtpI family protein n=1 Tax=Salimicrobium sp. PL1-032A TaxID=3095364 RepID=UPI0032611C23
MDRDKQGSFRAIGLTSAISSQLAGGPLIGIFFGRWLDGQFATGPLFLIIGLLAGLGTGTYGTIHLVRKYTGDD